MKISLVQRAALLALVAAAALPAAAQSTPASSGTYQLRMLTPETALAAIRDAIEF